MWCYGAIRFCVRECGWDGCVWWGGGGGGEMIVGEGVGGGVVRDDGGGKGGRRNLEYLCGVNPGYKTLDITQS